VANLRNTATVPWRRIDAVASDRVDVRSEGSLTGDVTPGRVVIGDGAFFKSGIDI